MVLTARIIRQRELVRRPWKNGGGTTAEIAVDPPGADLDTFDWRISMADVTSDGPFSLFPGVDRTLALMEGAAIDLEIDGTLHRLDADHRFLAFSGSAAVEARIPSGPIRDLNVMTRRSRASHRMTLVSAGELVAGSPGASLVMVALENDCSMTIDEEPPRVLDRGDTLLLTQAVSRIRVDRAALKIDIVKR